MDNRWSILGFSRDDSVLYFIVILQKSKNHYDFLEKQEKVSNFALKLIFFIYKSSKTMKKTFLMAVTALMMAINMNAQEGYEDTKHEVSIALGVGSTSQLFDTYEDIGNALFGWDSKDEKYIGPISAEYFYHINKWLGIGSIFVFGNYKVNLYDNGYGYYSYSRNNSNKRLGKKSCNYYTLLPTVKFNFVRKTHFGLYSKAGLGVTYRTESTEYNFDNDYDTDKSFLLNWQLSFIGVEAGSPYLRGFAELGLGEQGVVCAGLRYKF